MKIIGIISLVLGIFLVLAVMLGVQGLLGGDWETTGADVATIIIAVVVFAMIVYSIFHFMRR